jgi:hypothetical protein
MHGLRRMDEMGASINRVAIRWAWAYASLFLLVWVLYDWVKTGTFNALAFILMTSQLVVYWSIQIFLRWKLGKDEK